MRQRKRKDTLEGKKKKGKEKKKKSCPSTSKQPAIRPNIKHRHSTLCSAQDKKQNELSYDMMRARD
jgi:hypothetical protein